MRSMVFNCRSHSTQAKCCPLLLLLVRYQIYSILYSLNLFSTFCLTHNIFFLIQVQEEHMCRIWKLSNVRSETTVQNVFNLITTFFLTLCYCNEDWLEGKVVELFFIWTWMEKTGKDLICIKKMRSLFCLHFSPSVSKISQMRSSGFLFLPHKNSRLSWLLTRGLLGDRNVF